MRTRGRLRRFLSETTAASLSVLAVSYIVFWGCAWTSTRSVAAPPALPIAPADLGAGETLATEVGVSVMPAAPTSAGSVWLTHDLDERYQVFGGIGVSGGLLGAGATPFGGLRLMFDPIESLRIGLELSGYFETGWSTSGITSEDGLYLQPGVGVGLPLAWRFLHMDLVDAPFTMSLYTDPTLSIGPAWGAYSAVGNGDLDRALIVRVPAGLGASWDRFRVFLETGVQGAGGNGPRYIMVPPPFPYLAGGASFAF